MRKVFLAMTMLGKVMTTKYISDDYDLGDARFDFPLSYIAKKNIKENDQVVFVTALGDGEVEKQNYEKFKDEIVAISKLKNVEPQFVKVDAGSEFDSLTFNLFFRKIFDLLQEDDRIYMDITFGMKPYTLSMFIAMAFAAKVSENIHVEEVVYSQKYTGAGADGVSTSKLYDLSSIFYLNSIGGNLQTGKRKDAEQLLDFLIGKSEG